MKRARAKHIPFDELGVLVDFRRRRKPAIAQQRKRYWRVLEALRRTKP